MYSGKEADFEDEPEEGRGDDPEDGRGDNGDVAVAKSRVATSSELTTGLPQEEQKRTSADNSVPQKTQFDMKISRYRIPQRGNFRLRARLASRGSAAVLYYHPKR
jgi:hypothetical protein